MTDGNPADTEMRPRRVDWRNASDADLAAGFADGNDPCLEESFRRWGSLIYTIAYRALCSASEAEDVTQQVFVGAWQARTNYRESKEPFQAGCLASPDTASQIVSEHVLGTFEWYGPSQATRTSRLSPNHSSP